MYIQTFCRPILTFKKFYNRSEFKMIRNFNNKFQQRETRSRDEDYQHSAVSNAFRTRQIKSIDDWMHLKKDLSESIRQITETNFDSVALAYCLRTKDYKLAELCLKFIQEENKNFNLGVIGKMFHIYQGMQENNIFPGNYDESVFKMYENIRSKYKVLDSITLESAIVALSCTKHWRICLDLLKEIKIACVPNALSYNQSVAAAIRNGEYSTGWDLIHEMIANNRPTGDVCYRAILLDCIENKTKENFQNLLDFFNKFDVICSLEILNLLEQAAATFKYKPKAAILNEIGKCNNCVKYLPRINLTPQEFDELKNAFFNEAIMGKNVYCKTTPDEVDRFKKFLETGTKYHVVVDGLNVAFATGSTNPLVMANTLSCVVDYFTAREKRVLVLGRMHMMKWPGKYMSQIKRNADIFFTQNLSYDDPYLIYCALNAGQNTIVITKDYMRSHLYLLKSDEHKRLFKRWLVQCRYEFVRVQNNGSVIFTKPLPYLQNCQETESGWHVPYLLDGETITTNGRINNWLCIQK